MSGISRGKISHAELYVSDLKKSTDFWGWLLEYLGYEKYQEWDEGISWIKENFYLVLVQVEDRFLNRGYHRCGVGLNHLAFFADTKEEIDDLTGMLIERNITLLYLDKHPYAGGRECYAVYFEDPDRIKVEVVCCQGNQR